VDADEDIRKSRLMHVCVCVCQTKERDKQTDACTQAHPETHQTADDEDYEILRHPPFFSVLLFYC
jgi:hypothetical protein